MPKNKFKYRVVTLYRSGARRTTKPVETIEQAGQYKMTQMNKYKVRVVWVEYFENNKWVSFI